MGYNIPTNVKRILQIEIHPLIWEILAEKGKGFDRSAHQEAKRILLESMYKQEMLPKKDLPTILGELIYGVIKYEKVKNGK